MDPRRNGSMSPEMPRCDELQEPLLNNVRCLMDAAPFGFNLRTFNYRKLAQFSLVRRQYTSGGVDNCRIRFFFFHSRLAFFKIISHFTRCYFAYCSQSAGYEAYVRDRIFGTVKGSLLSQALFRDTVQRFSYFM